jgi:RHS repeat-associated protein
LDYLPFGYEVPSSVGLRQNVTDACAGQSAHTYSEDPVFRQKFTGKERDAETGLDFFGARYFSGAQGRFTSPDPKIFSSRHLMQPQKWNKYAYVQNNPLARFDPDGADDYFVFRPLAGDSPTNNEAWARLEARTNRPGSPNHMTVYPGDRATAANYQAAVATPGAHVIDMGHTFENNVGQAGAVLFGDNLAVGDTTMPPVPALDLSFSGGLMLSFGGGPVLPLGDVQAADVAIFSCNSADLLSQYASGIAGQSFTFTGTSPGVGTGPADAGALVYTQTMVIGGSASLAGAMAQGALQTATDQANADPANNQGTPYAPPHVSTTADGVTTRR